MGRRQGIGRGVGLEHVHLGAVGLGVRPRRGHGQRIAVAGVHRVVAEDRGAHREHAGPAAEVQHRGELGELAQELEAPARRGVRAGSEHPAGLDANGLHPVGRLLVGRADPQAARDLEPMVVLFPDANAGRAHGLDSPWPEVGGQRERRRREGGHLEPTFAVAPLFHPAGEHRRHAGQEVRRIEPGGLGGHGYPQQRGHAVTLRDGPGGHGRTMTRRRRRAAAAPAVTCSGRRCARGSGRTATARS